tara:strand:- start:87 stop:248 length:162 start_codon:yes stop_codon:yes gene_type:complete
MKVVKESVNPPVQKSSIDTSSLNEVLKYLQDKPWKEVNGLINLIMASELEPMG